MSLVVIRIAVAWVCALRHLRRGCGSTSTSWVVHVDVVLQVSLELLSPHFTASAWKVLICKLRWEVIWVPFEFIQNFGDTVPPVVIICKKSGCTPLDLVKFLDIHLGIWIRYTYSVFKNQPYDCVNQPYVAFMLASALRKVSGVQLYKNNTHVQLSRIWVSWIQIGCSMYVVYVECMNYHNRKCLKYKVWIHQWLCRQHND